MSLPPRNIPIFDGDSLQYRIFIKAFEQGVEEKARLFVLFRAIYSQEIWYVQ